MIQSLSNQKQAIILIILGFLAVLVTVWAIAAQMSFVITALVGLAVLIFVLARPVDGIILLLILLYINIYSNISLGPVTISVTTIPVLGLALAALMKLAGEKNKRTIDNWQKALLVSLMTVFLLTTMLSYSISKSLLLLPNLFLYILILFSIMVLVDSPEQLIKFAKVTVVLAVVATIWKDIDQIIGLPRVGTPNSIAFAHHPALVICLAVLLLPIPGLSRGWRLFLTGALVLLVVDFIRLGARAAILAGMISIFLVLSRVQLKRQYKLVTIFLIFLGLLGFVYQSNLQQHLINTQAALYVSRSGTNQEDLLSGDRTRLIARDAALQMFQDHPVLGWGPNLFSTYKPLYAVGEEKYVKGLAWNSWLMVLAEMGLIGIFVIGTVFLAPFIVIWLRLGSKKNGSIYLVYTYALIVIALSIHLFFIDSLYSSFVWIYVGFALAATRIGLRDNNMVSKQLVSMDLH